MANSGRESPADTGRAAARDRSGRVSFLDQALWKQFSEATSPEALARAWLGLQCRLISGVGRGVVILGEAPDEGPFTPVAYWPEEAPAEGALSRAAELAMAERRGVVQGQEVDQAGSGEPCQVAYPFLVDDRLFGVVAIEVDAGQRSRLRGVMRQLQWGAGWIEVLLRREQNRSDRALIDRTATAFNLLALTLEQERFEAACNAAATELAMRLDCDQVSVGFRRRGRVKVAALSHAAQFGRRMNLVRDIGAAMDEAVDQEAVVLYPQEDDWDYRIVRAHAELARVHDAGAILTVPLHAGGRVFGALTFERPHGEGFDDETVELCDSVAGVLGPVLEEKRRNDRLVLGKVVESLWVQLKRLFGPHYFGRKLATAAAAAVAGFFAIAEGEYRVTSPATLEGEVQRALVAPFDGYVADQQVRAGKVVREGQVLAALDGEELALERLRWTTKRRQHMTEYDEALAAGERAKAKIIQAQIAEADAEIALLDVQLARTELRAPFDGLVISGDLSQSVGGAVKRGDELFKIAPLDAYRIVLQVDERDVSEVEVGQRGHLVLSSIPGESLGYTVERVTPIAKAEEGQNFFRVEAELHEANARLRPGMEGVAKTSVEDRLLIRIWTDRLIDWVRLQAWKWLS